MIFLFVFTILSASPVFAAKAKGKPTPPVSSPVPNSICIDAGHGGSETGAINGDLVEKDVNLDITT